MIVNRRKNKVISQFSYLVNELESYDLIDFFLPRNNKIFPLNKIKESLAVIRKDAIVRNMYKGIGVCSISQIIESTDLEKICKYYLVWHKLNNDRKTSNQSTTTNFQFCEYINEFLYDPTQLPSNSEVLEHVKRLRNGWNYPIEIIVAYDTAINMGLIVDATKHSLALYYIKETEEERLQMLLRENDVVNLCQMKSFHCRNIFYHDFARLISSR
jgi:hypothetical protein